MVSRRTNFGERSEPAPNRGGKLQSAGGRHKVTFRHCFHNRSPRYILLTALCGFVKKEEN